MGAGSFPCGVGPCGHDLVEGAIGTSLGPTAGSPRFDPATRQYAVDDEGAIERDERGVLLDDPIWQEVEHRLGVPLRSLPNSPQIGIDIERIRNTPRSQAQRTLEDEVRRALGPMIERGDVAVERVVIAEPWSGKWEPWIRNLRAQNAEVRAIRTAT